MKTILTVLCMLGLAWLLVGCEAPPAEPASPASNSMIEVGQTTQPIGKLAVEEGGNNNTSGCIDCEPEWPHACSLLSSGHSVVLIHLPKQEPVVHLLPEDECSGPYSNDAVTMSAEVLGVAWGEPVPQNLNLTTVADKDSTAFNPYLGGLYYFVNLRASQGEYFAMHSLRVRLDGEQITPSGTHRPFPDTFEGVVEELANTRSHFSEICPRQANSSSTDEEFERRMRDARSSGYDCIPDGPPPAEQPPSEECTDLYPCDP